MADQISIESVIFSNHVVEPGELLTCNITVKNTGSTILTNLKYAYYTVNGGNPIQLTFPSYLTPGSTTSKSFVLDTQNTGTITVCAYSNFP